MSCSTSEKISEPEIDVFSIANFLVEPHKWIETAKAL